MVGKAHHRQSLANDQCLKGVSTYRCNSAYNKQHGQMVFMHGKTKGCWSPMLPRFWTVKILLFDDNALTRLRLRGWENSRSSRQHEPANRKASYSKAAMNNVAFVRRRFVRIYHLFCLLIRLGCFKLKLLQIENRSRWQWNGQESNAQCILSGRICSGKNSTMKSDRRSESQR